MESEEGWKSLLMKVKEESEKAGLKLNIQKWRSWHLVPSVQFCSVAQSCPTLCDPMNCSMPGLPVHRFMASRWGNNVSNDRLYFLGLQNCSVWWLQHEIKRHLLLGRKVMISLDSILKSRDFTLPTKVCLVKTMVFPVFMYGYESWTIKKAECQRIDAFELWCWRRLLRVPWTARRSNQLVLQEISPEYSLERLMLKLKVLYFGHLM